jgi:hypothetical protein
MNHVIEMLKHTVYIHACNVGLEVSYPSRLIKMFRVNEVIIRDLTLKTIGLVLLCYE